MSEDSDLESSEDQLQRLAKKLKRDEVKVNIDPQIDITQLAIQKYQTVKKDYNFVSFSEADKSKMYKNCKTQVHSIPIYDFNQQMHRFRRNGYCADPDTQTKGLVFGSKLKEFKEKSQLQGEVIDQTNPQFLQQLYPKTTNKTKKELTKIYKQTRESKGDDIQSYRGPWAGYGENLYNGALTQEQKNQLAKAEETKQIKVQQAKHQQRNFEPYSAFHWGQHSDYKGLSYLEPPANYKKGGQNCYLPKNEVFSWVGSQKAGLQVVRFFPKVGNFFLLGTPEGKAHLFDIAKNKTCAQTYHGHAKALRDVQFSHDGKHFLSGGFDNKILYWDTEYGKAVSTFNLKGIPFTIKFHPSQRLPNVFFVGSSNKKILQFDLKTCSKTMQYNQHLAAVNTLTFIEENKFLSSSDDKKLFIWEYGVPVVTRHVSEPEMHSITATAMHPSGEFFAGQSSNNQIVIYENKGGNFRKLLAKKFASHYCAGYACTIDFSYDGQFLLSGDQRGKIYCYDWKTSKVFRILDGHAGACIGVEWHPSQPTTVVSCGWEGMVKLWQ